MSDSDLFHRLVSGVETRAKQARKQAWFLPRKERQKFIYDQTYRNDIEAVAYPLAKGIGRLPNFVTPRTFVEKCRALYLTHPNPLMSLAACKIEMRRLCDYYDTPIKPAKCFGTYTDPADLDLSTLPETCYLKVADGCKMNIVHARGMPVTPLWYKIFQWEWWNLDHWRRHAELHYRDIPRRLLVEEALLPHTTLRETGIYCVFGTPYVYKVEGNSFDGHERFKGHIPLDDKYADLAARYGKPIPANLAGTSDDMEAMLETARRLSRPFAHCRVDFMQNGDRTIVGEITLSPGALWLPDRRPEQELARGDLIDFDRLNDALELGWKIASDLGWPLETSFGHFTGDPRLETGGQ